ncbi:MAG: hypothetical protein QM482_05590 [Sulfurospirillum sp.]
MSIQSLLEGLFILPIQLRDLIDKKSKTLFALAKIFPEIRKITKTKGGFNSNESLFKLVFLAYKDIAKKWEKSISNWAEIISQFSIIFEDRLNGYIR